MRLADALHNLSTLVRPHIGAACGCEHKANQKISAHPKFSLDTNEARAGGLSGGVMNAIVGLGASELATLAPQRSIRPGCPHADAKGTVKRPRKWSAQGLCLYDRDPGKIYCVMVLACPRERKTVTQRNPVTEAEVLCDGPPLCDGSVLFGETSSRAPFRPHVPSFHIGSTHVCL